MTFRSLHWDWSWWEVFWCQTPFLSLSLLSFPFLKLHPFLMFCHCPSSSSSSIPSSSWWARSLWSLSPVNEGCEGGGVLPSSPHGGPTLLHRLLHPPTTPSSSLSSSSSLPSSSSSSPSSLNPPSHPIIIVITPTSSSQLSSLSWFQLSSSSNAPSHHPIIIVINIISINIVITTNLSPGRHNLQSFLAANLTQNHFLIAHKLSFFCDIRNKSALSNILQQNVTNFDIGNG